MERRTASADLAAELQRLFPIQNGNIFTVYPESLSGGGKKRYYTLHDQHELPELYQAHVEGRIHDRGRDRPFALSAQIVDDRGRARWAVLDVEADDHADGWAEHEVKTVASRLIQTCQDYDFSVVVATSTKGRGFHILLPVAEPGSVNELLTEVVTFLLRCAGVDRGVEVLPGRRGDSTRGKPVSLPGGRLCADRCGGLLLLSPDTLEPLEDAARWLAGVTPTDTDHVQALVDQQGIAWSELGGPARGSAPFQIGDVPAVFRVMHRQPGGGQAQLQRLWNNQPNTIDGNPSHFTSDFHLACMLLEMGYSREEAAAVLLEFPHGQCAWQAEHGYEDDQEAYAIRTVENAWIHVQSDQPDHRPKIASQPLDELRRVAQREMHQAARRPGRYLMDAGTGTGKTTLCEQQMAELSCVYSTVEHHHIAEVQRKVGSERVAQIHGYKACLVDDSRQAIHDGFENGFNVAKEVCPTCPRREECPVIESQERASSVPSIAITHARLAQGGIADRYDSPDHDRSVLLLDESPLGHLVTTYTFTRRKLERYDDALAWCNTRLTLVPQRSRNVVQSLITVHRKLCELLLRRGFRVSGKHPVPMDDDLLGLLCEPKGFIYLGELDRLLNQARQEGEAQQSLRTAFTELLAPQRGPYLMDVPAGQGQPASVQALVTRLDSSTGLEEYPTIVLCDAHLPKRALELLIGGRWCVFSEETGMKHARRQGRLVQIPSWSVSKRWLRGARNRRTIVDWICAVHREHHDGKPLGLITHKEFERGLCKAVKAELGAQQKVCSLHFGQEVGRRDFEDIPVQHTIGAWRKPEATYLLYQRAMVDSWDEVECGVSEVSYFYRSKCQVEYPGYTSEIGQLAFDLLTSTSMSQAAARNRTELNPDHISYVLSPLPMYDHDLEVLRWDELLSDTAVRRLARTRDEGRRNHSRVPGQIAAILTDHDGMCRGELVGAVLGRHGGSRRNIYKQIARLLDTGDLDEDGGTIRLA